LLSNKTHVSRHGHPILTTQRTIPVKRERQEYKLSRDNEDERDVIRTAFRKWKKTSNTPRTFDDSDTGTYNAP